MGADRTSIHKPDYCLPGQGWSIDKKETVNIPIEGSRPYQLPVAKWTIAILFRTPDGRKEKVCGLYVFWFVADNEETRQPLPAHLVAGAGFVAHRRLATLGLCFVFCRVRAGPGRRGVCAHGKIDRGLRAGISIAAGHEMTVRR